MLTNTKIALSLALFAATATGAMAAPNHAVGHHSAIAHSPVARQMPTTTYLSYGSAIGPRRVANPTYMNNPDIAPIKQYPGD
jgi:hypothetical protein